MKPAAPASRRQRGGTEEGDPGPASPGCGAERGGAAPGTWQGGRGALPLPRAPARKMAAAAGAGAGAGGAAAAALWSEVNRCGQNGDFARALKSVNKSECRRGFGVES